ncbi:hypothetical protein BH10BAC5_BH10BAC5_28470 [soil metagenome]
MDNETLSESDHTYVVVDVNGKNWVYIFDGLGNLIEFYKE